MSSKTGVLWTGRINLGTYCLLGTNARHSVYITLT